MKKNAKNRTTFNKIWSILSWISLNASRARRLLGASSMLASKISLNSSLIPGNFSFAAAIILLFSLNPISPAPKLLALVLNQLHVIVKITKKTKVNAFLGFCFKYHVKGAVTADLKAKFGKYINYFFYKKKGEKYERIMNGVCFCGPGKWPKLIDEIWLLLFSLLSFSFSFFYWVVEDAVWVGDACFQSSNFYLQFLDFVLINIWVP